MSFGGISPLVHRNGPPCNTRKLKATAACGAGLTWNDTSRASFNRVFGSREMDKLKLQREAQRGGCSYAEYSLLIGKS